MSEMHVVLIFASLHQGKEGLSHFTQSFTHEHTDSQNIQHNKQRLYLNNILLFLVYSSKDNMNLINPYQKTSDIIQPFQKE